MHKQGLKRCHEGHLEVGVPVDSQPPPQHLHVLRLSIEKLHQALFTLEKEVQTAASGLLLLVILRVAVLGQEPQEVLALEHVERARVTCVNTRSQYDKVGLNKSIDVLVSSEILEKPCKERCGKLTCPWHLIEQSKKVHQSHLSQSIDLEKRLQNLVDCF